MAEVAAWTATNELRADLTAHLLRLDLAFFHRHPPGELIDRVDGDVSRLASFLSDMAVIVIGNVLLVAGIVVALFLQDWLTGLAFALFCLVTILWLRPLVGHAVPRLTARRQAEAELMGFLEERLGATEDLRANGAAAYAMTGLHERQRVQFRVALRAARVAILWPASVQGLMGLGLAMALALGAFLYMNHRATLGGALVLVAYMQMLRSPLMGITAQFQIRDRRVEEGHVVVDGRASSSVRAAPRWAGHPGHPGRPGPAAFRRTGAHRPRGVCGPGSRRASVRRDHRPAGARARIPCTRSAADQRAESDSLPARRSRNQCPTRGGDQQAGRRRRRAGPLHDLVAHKCESRFPGCLGARDHSQDRRRRHARRRRASGSGGRAQPHDKCTRHGLQAGEPPDGRRGDCRTW